MICKIFDRQLVDFSYDCYLVVGLKVCNTKEGVQYIILRKQQLW